MDDKSLAEAYMALSNEKRIQLLRLIIRSDQPLSNTALSSLTGMHENTTSSHMASLVRAGFVVKTHSGRWVLYRANEDIFEILNDYWKGVFSDKS